MKPKKKFVHPKLFQSRLDQIINLDHALCQVSQKIDWEAFDSEYGQLYEEKYGRPGISTRLMVALHYLRYTFNLSDEEVVARFVENPYWQYFGGFEYFQHQFPIDPSSMTRWRKRIGPDRIELLLQKLIELAVETKMIHPRDITQLNVDTTVQEKAITFPTDAKLYHRLREKLVAAAGSRGILLRQSYVHLSKRALHRQGNYAHAKQMKRSAREVKRLKIYLGCVYRDIKRKVEQADEELESLLAMAERLLNQKRNDKHKLYSLHAPEVDCISKGKAHKRYEFGSKVGIATTSKSNWIVGVKVFHGNPYDGHTLDQTRESVRRVTDMDLKHVQVDKGYRGHNYRGDAEIRIVDNRKIKKQTRSVRGWFKRRSAIEPVIGHMKSDNRLNRNYLKGKKGDEINAILSGCGFNLRKLLAAFLLPNFTERYLGVFLDKLTLKISKMFIISDQDIAVYCSI